MMDSEDCHCSLNETELFDSINKQILLDKAQWVDVHPLNNVSSDGPIEFSINGSSDEFLDFNNTMLQLRVKIINATGNANLIPNDVIAPVNNWMHSMFSDVILTISGQQVEGGSHQYPYKAYLSNLLLYSTGSKKTHLQASGWYKDTANKFEDGTAENKGFTTRHEITDESKTVEMWGPLILDFMLQNKYILQNLDIGIKLVRSKPEFQVMIKTGENVGGKATAVKVKLEKAVLYVRRVKALPSVTNEIEEKLNLQNAIYPIQRTEMLTYTISQGSKSHSKEALFRGNMPKMVFIAMVRNDAYNGSYAHNPFHFQHFNLNQMALYREGESIPFRPFTPDFGTNKFYIREYMALMQSLEVYNKNEDVDITPFDFANGYGIFGFNLTPDLSVAGHAQTSRDGNIRLEVQFGTALPQTINVVVMGVFDGRVEITKHRNILLDWKS